ncbi:hypothetical protein PS043_09915 [Escherichia albertii]|uniref:hypothetical protein n=1 Tax=Escherichia albertii TaxID=208962 RepID=UPI00235EC99F|nr:hypothetical protein [Escherichia albertii]WDC31612.1 hypothetical protein PS043_09915 [Escherichia albertii]
MAQSPACIIVVVDNALASWSARSACLQDDQPLLPVRPPQYRNAKASEAKYIYTGQLHRHRFTAMAFTGCKTLFAGFSRLPHTLLTSSALYMTGCGAHCRQALLPRDRQPAPETQCLPSAPDEASL